LAIQFNFIVLIIFQSMLARMESLINQLKKDKESSIDQLKRLQQDMQAAVLKIKVPIS
jgi:Chemotaxis protein histidine kinase and related kinases